MTCRILELYYFSYNKSQRDALFLKFILIKNYMFWTDLLSIIRSLNTVYTAIGQDGICSILTSLAINITSMTNTYCCVYTVETPDDGQ